MTILPPLSMQFLFMYDRTSFSSTTFQRMKEKDGKEQLGWSCEKWRSVLYVVKEEKNNLQTIKRRKANWIGHILHRNCLLKHVIEEKIGVRIKVTGRWGRRCKQLLVDLKEMRVLEMERGSTRSYSLENLLWERIWTCKTDNRINEWRTEHV
jgi:hypothetical protein